ncbi:unnamed protein product [Cunninghamella blakesleeana]
MTHLSDYSFLQRTVSLYYLLIWYTYRVWSLDRFRCIRISRFKQGEIKGIVTLLLFIFIPFQLFYEITSCKVKYEEGFANVFGHIFTKPETMWTQADKDFIIPTDYSLCIGFSFQTGTLLLLQCFWNYLANTVAKRNFMSSKEFKLYIVWTCITAFLFPILQYNFSRDIYPYTYKEIMPELVYGCGLFIIACLGIRSHFRFNQLLNKSAGSLNTRYVNNKISYFQELNFILTIALFFFSISLIILCADGLTGAKYLNVHKFPSDFLICNTNVASIVVWVIVILIFHPKKQNEENNSVHPPAYVGQQQQQQQNQYNSRQIGTHLDTISSATSSSIYPPTAHNIPIGANNNMLDMMSTAIKPDPSNASSYYYPNPTLPQQQQQNHHPHHNQYYQYSYSQSSNATNHHHHHLQQQQAFSYKSSTLTLLNESNISNTSSNMNSTTTYEGDSMFTSRQPLIDASLYNADRKPNEDSQWLHQLPKGR